MVLVVAFLERSERIAHCLRRCNQSPTVIYPFLNLIKHDLLVVKQCRVSEFMVC